jgi:23S rRNA pseudouridine1911/1915/1917 synthase
VVAKTREAQLQLTRLFAERKIKKTYAAIVCGIPRFYHERIETLIGRHRINRQKMAVVDRNGKEAITEFDLLHHGQIDGAPASVLSVRIFTGRTHQIRVHLAYKKLPILGDLLYGGHQKLSAPRQMLHAWKIRFPHPITGREMTFKAPWPEDFAELASRLGPLPGEEEGAEVETDGEWNGEEQENRPGADGNWME